MEFKVVKINQEFKNVVVSHKALIEAWSVIDFHCFPKTNITEMGRIKN